MVKTLQQDRLKLTFFKMVPKEDVGSIKVFGDVINPSVPHKTFLISKKDTTDWLVKKVLEKYGLKHEDPKSYCLIQVLIPPRYQLDNKVIKEIILLDKECPLNIYLNHSQRGQGTIIFKIIKCPPEYSRIRKQEATLDRSQVLSIQDRTINDQLPMFLEINQDGTDLSSPRVFKVYPDMTRVGRDAKSANEKQYFYIDGIGINRDHCTIQNQNDVVTLIPRGEILLNGKLISTSFILKHGAVVRFGRNTKYCYYDPKSIQKSKSIIEQKKQQNKNKIAAYSSLPILNMNDNDKTNESSSKISPSQLKKSSTDLVENGKKINVLPGLLEVPAKIESQFLHAVFDNYPLENIHFRLSPAYTIYMALRHRLSPYGKMNVSHFQKQESTISFLNLIEDMINKKIEECQQHSGYLTYWLANTSELLYFLKRDRDLLKLSHDIQVRLTESIHRLFDYLINSLQNELDKYLMVLLDLQDDIAYNIHSNMTDTKLIQENNSNMPESSNPHWTILDQNSNRCYESTLDNLLSTLSGIMSLLRKCRVNVALTIQIFSKLFHYMSTWLFNRIVCYPELKLCSSMWGEKLLTRLKSINDWAQEQGLELSSECHLMKVNQLCLLLKSSKCNSYDVQELLLNQTFNINSIQITQILNNYVLNRNEPSISNSFYQALLSGAYKYVDENLYLEGSPIQLAEETNLAVPFFLPEDGYSCENIRGIPEKLLEFIEPLSQAKLCHLFVNSFSFGLWIEFMQTPKIDITIHEDNDKIETIVINKKGNNLGLSIVSAKSDSQPNQGIYIKGIIPGGAAQDDGRLQIGDQILYVDQIDLLDKTKEQAAAILKQCGPSVTLKIRKNAAVHHGIAALFASLSNNHYDSTSFHSGSNSSSISYQHPHSTLARQTINSYEQLSTNQKNFKNRHQYNLLSSLMVQNGLRNDLYANGKVNQQLRSLSSSYLTESDQVNPYLSQQHQSNPNIFNSKQINQQQFHNHDNVFLEKNFTRSTSRTKSLIAGHVSRAKSIVFREDIPPNSCKDSQIKAAIAPKTLPKPVINIFSFTKRPYSTDTLDISKGSSKASLCSSSDYLTPTKGKSLSEENELKQLTSTREKSASEIRSKRIHDLINKFNRTEHEQKELNNLKLDDEFDRRVEEFYSQMNENNHQKNSSQIISENDEINEFDEKLKRRLEQFEQEREVERASINRMIAKNENDIELRLRKDREREMRAYRDMQDFKVRRLGEEEKIIQAKKEQTRILKHMHFPNPKVKTDRLSDIADKQSLHVKLNSDNSDCSRQQNSSSNDERILHGNAQLQLLTKK